MTLYVGREGGRYPTTLPSVCLLIITLEITMKKKKPSVPKFDIAEAELTMRIFQAQVAGLCVFILGLKNGGWNLGFKPMQIAG